jgi:hypothetical protein
MHGGPFPPALRLFSQRLRAKRSRASTLRSELSLVRCAQPGRGKPLVYVRSGLSLAGSADKALALEARRCSPGLLAQTNNRLRQSIFESFSLLNTTTLLHALLHPLEDWRERDRRSHHRILPRNRAVMAARCGLIPRNTTAKN